MEILTSQYAMLFGQLLLAVLLGAAIGLERTLARKNAGMRTFAFVSLGSAMFTIISVHALDFAPLSVLAAGTDPTRIAAQIVSGIGFLGAGVIIFNQSKLQGVTTAAGFWLAAAIGMAIGFKLYALAIFGAILAFVVFHLLFRIEKKIREKQPFYKDVEDGE